MDVAQFAIYRSASMYDDLRKSLKRTAYTAPRIFPVASSMYFLRTVLIYYRKKDRKYADISTTDA